MSFETVSPAEPMSIIEKFQDKSKGPRLGGSLALQLRNMT